MPIVTGSHGADNIHGTSLGDRISSGTGDDLVLGDGADGPHPAIYPEPMVGPAPQGNVIGAGSGSDTVFAGYGADTVCGGGGNDLIFGWGVLATSGLYRDGYARDADGNDVLRGGGGDDTIRGGGGADIVYGGAGDDLIDGGVGADTLYGGAGADRFVFGAFDARSRSPVADTRGDVIVDFQHGLDYLDFSAFARRLPGVATDALGEGAFTDPTHLQVRSLVIGADTRVVIHLPGGSPNDDAIVTLRGVHHLTAADIVFA